MSDSRHLTLYDFRDLDLMMKVASEADHDGAVTTHDLAEALGFGEDVRAVAMRLAWGRKYGFFERDEQAGIWRLSRGGARVVEAHEAAADIPAIADVPDPELVDVMAHVASRYRHGDAMTAHLLRREFLFGTSPTAYQRNGRRRR